jgi:hypothetical protein
VVSSTTRPLRVSRPKIQLLGEVLIGGLALSAGLLLLLQALADRRRPTADRAALPPAPSPPSPPHPASSLPPPAAPEARPRRSHLIDYESLWLEDEEESPPSSRRDRADDRA